MNFASVVAAALRPTGAGGQQRKGKGTQAKTPAAGRRKGAGFVTTLSGSQRTRPIAAVSAPLPSLVVEPQRTAPTASLPVPPPPSSMEMDDFSLDDEEAKQTPVAASMPAATAASVTSSVSPASSATVAAVDLTDSPVKAKQPAAAPLLNTMRPGRAQRVQSLVPVVPPHIAASSSSAAAPILPAASPAGPVSSRSGITLQCMLCGISLAMMALDERQKHINTCLDQLSQSPLLQQSTHPSLPPPRAPPLPAHPSSAASHAVTIVATRGANVHSRPRGSPLLQPTPPSDTAAFTPQKRKQHSPECAPVAAATVASSPGASRGDSNVLVIDDDDDPMPAASLSSAVPSPGGGVRRSITDFFGMRSGRAAATPTPTPTAALRHASPAPASAPAILPPLKRARTVPTDSSVMDSTVPAAAAAAAAASAASSSSADVVASAVPSTAEAVQAAASAAAAANFAAEKTADAWKFLLTGRKSGTLAPAGGGWGKGGRGGKGASKKGEPELDENGLPLISTPQGNIAGQSVSRYGGTKGGGLPAHKRLPGTSILTDAFMFTRAIQAMRWPPEQPPLFFLSHFHADHYAGLSRSWNAGSIFCSEITARLVRNAFGETPHVVVLPMHTRLEIGGVRVTLIDAHHCPGAVIFVFETQPFAPATGVCFDFLPPDLAAKRRQEEQELIAQRAAAAAATTTTTAQVPQEDAAAVLHRRRAHLPHGKVYVHGGDMRYHSSMRELFLPHASPAPEPTWSKALSAAPSPYLPASYVPLAYPSLAFRHLVPHLRELSISCVYLDTTYCSPRYQFPPQAVSVAHVLSVVGECLAKERRAGVSSLVDASANSKAVRSKLDFFKPLGAKNDAVVVDRADSSVAAAAVAEDSQSAVPDADGVAAFLTQVPGDAAAEPADMSVADSIDPAVLDELPVVSSSGAAEADPELGGSEFAEDLDPQHAAESGAAADEEDEDGDQELEDLMMQDYDRRDEEDEQAAAADHSFSDMPMLEGNEEGAAAAVASSGAAAAAAADSSTSSSAVGNALSSLWSSASASVSSSVSHLRSNLSLASSFLSGYRRAALSRTLFLVGSYSIGKEKIFVEIARQFGLKIFVPAYRLKTIKMLDLFEEGPTPAAVPSVAQQMGSSAGIAAASASTPCLAAGNSATPAATASVEAILTRTSSPSKQPAAPSSTSFSSPSAPSSASIQREWRSWSVDDVLTTCVGGARLHVIPLSYVNHKSIGLHIDPSQNAHMPSSVIEQFHRVVAFRPTGWVGNKPTHSERVHTVTLLPNSKKVPADSAEAQKARASKIPAIAAAATPNGKRGKGGGGAMVSVPAGPVRHHALSVSVHGVPYSEHSTYPELEHFVSTLAQCGLQQIVPTVNVASVRDQVNKHWGHLLNRPAVAASSPIRAAAAAGNSAPATASAIASPAI